MEKNISCKDCIYLKFGGKYYGNDVNDKYYQSCNKNMGSRVDMTKTSGFANVCSLFEKKI
jgi:hypothetical protein